MSSQEHPAERLWRQHGAVAPYPDGVIAVPQPIPGVSFFPGGYGLWRPQVNRPLPAWPLGGVMILGHDFHSERGYRKSLARGREVETQPTWRNLLALLSRAGIDRNDCFFTNAFMGLRRGHATTGIFPGARDSLFVARCREFLGDQIAAQQPRLIITLGKWVPSLLAPLSPELRVWRDLTRFKPIDVVGPVQRAVSFRRVENVAVVALMHPSMRQLGVRYRQFEELVGDPAEQAMLERALTPE